MPLPTDLQTTITGIDAATPVVAAREMYYRATQPAAYLSPKSLEALAGSLRLLAVNYPRLVVGSLAERLDLLGVDRAGVADLGLWLTLRRAGIVELAGHVHTDRLAYGASYVTTWVDGAGRLTLTADTAATMHVERDSATGATLFAGRLWSTPATATTPAGRGAALMYSDHVDIYRTVTPAASTSDAGAWQLVDTIPHGLGVVPVVQFVRRPSSTDPEIGVSAFADIVTLVDALNKILADSLVTSEYFARPRRWATGLEIEVDEETGRPIDPFGESRLLQSEAPDTKFGQLEPPSLAGYTDLVSTITQQIGALTGLPPHYLGLAGNQPASAEGVNAAENQLVQRADTEQTAVSASWAAVFDLAAKITGSPAGDLMPRWGDTQSRTPAQDADAAAKLAGIGVPLAALLPRLRFSPDDVALAPALAPVVAE